MNLLRRSLLIAGFLYSSLLNSSGSVDVHFSYAAEQPSAAATVVAPPAPKKKSPPNVDYFTGNPPIELLVDGSEFSFYSREPCCRGGGRPLVIKNGYMYVIDSSDTPIKKISTETGEITSLAQWTGSPVSAVFHDGALLWIEHTDTSIVGGRKPRLNRTSLDGLTTIVLADGFHNVNDGGSFDLLVDDTNAYWVNAEPVERCFPTGCFGGFLDWKIQKVPLAGGPSTTLATVENQIVSIARDATYIYWTEDGDAYQQQFLKRVPIAGGDVEIVVDAQLNGSATGWSPARGLVVDGGEVFFGAMSGLMKVPVSGGAVTILANASYAGPVLWKIIVTGQTVYWLDEFSIKQTPRNGGSSTILVNGLFFPARDFMVRDGSIIWSNCGQLVGSCDIQTMPLAGGTVTTLLTGLEGVRAFTTDGVSLYFIDGGYIRAYDNNGKIAKIPFTGGPPSTVLSAVMADISSAHAVDDFNVYFSDYTGIKKVPIDGGVVEILSPGLGQAGDLLTDGDFVYWLDGGLKKIPVDGGPVTLVTSPDTSGLFMDNDHFYWTEETWVWNGSSMDHLNMIKKAPKTGGPTELILSGGNLGMTGLDGSDIYFIEAGFPNIIKKISVNGGPITTIGGAADGSTLAFDDTYVYWGDHFSLQRAPKSGGPTTPIAMEPGVAFLTIDDHALYWLLTLEEGIAKLELSAIDRFLTLYTPNAGDAWTIGSHQSISWGFRGLPGKAKVEISRDGGFTWKSLSKKGINNIGLQSWKVSGPATNNARIRICILGPSSTTCDMSRAFSIQ